MQFCGAGVRKYLPDDCEHFAVTNKRIRFDVALNNVIKANILKQLAAELLEDLADKSLAISFSHQTLIQRQLAYCFKYFLPTNVVLLQDFFWVFCDDSLNLTDHVLEKLDGGQFRSFCTPMTLKIKKLFSKSFHV